MSVSAKHPHYAEHNAFLQQASRLLARTDPQIAHGLAQTGRDPDVDRLLEGIAFISSKIDEKRVAGVDEICQLMMAALFPHYLCPVPATTIVSFDNQMEQQPQRIPRGTELLSTPVAGTHCRFRTSHDTDVHGIVLDQVSWQRQGAGSVLVLRFSAPAWVRSKPPVDRVRLHLHGEPLVTRTVYHALMARLDEVVLVDEQQRPLDASGVRLRPVGYSEDEALLDYPLGSFDGFRVLQEYFVLPEKFLFIDVEGLWKSLRRAGGDRAISQFTLRFRVGDDQGLAVTKQHVRLACAPAVNLFSHTADPIRVDPGRVDYRVRPAGPHLHYELYRIEQVTGRGPQGNIEYAVFPELTGPIDSQPFVSARRRRNGDEVDTYLSLHDTGISPARTLSIDLTCSNGKLPAALNPGDIHELEGLESWQGACTNLQAPTNPVAIPVGPELRQRLLQHLRLCKRDLTDVDALRSVLGLYDLHATIDSVAAANLKRLQQSIVDTRADTLTRQHRGRPIRGRHWHVTINDRVLSVPYESYLCGSVLDEYAAAQTPLNWFSELTVHRYQSKEVHRWPTRLLAPDGLDRRTGL